LARVIAGLSVFCGLGASKKVNFGVSRRKEGEFEEERKVEEGGCEILRRFRGN
jgi:hypothetical protein